jgi:predicted dehydrogenase
MIKVGLIGYGYWGPNLLRNFASNPAFEVVAVADAREARRAEVRRWSPTAKLAESGEDIIAMPDIDAVAIATPVATHYRFARQALEAGKHVLVEKPMSANSEEAKDLVQLADARNRVLMVDHTFLFTGVVQMIRRMIDQGDLGRISYIDSMRVNLGLFQPDVNVLWDLGPHDLSIVDYLLGETPIHVEASGYCHVNSHLPDIAYLTLHYPSRIVVHLNLSWMSPVKVRRLAIGGSTKMLVWDDLNSEEKIKIYNSGIEFQPQEERNVVVPEYRIGDIFSPRVPLREALEEVIDHFAKVIAGKAKSIMDGRSGLRVITVLEEAQRALDTSLAQVSRTKANRQWAAAS